MASVCSTSSRSANQGARAIASRAAAAAPSSRAARSTFPLNGRDGGDPLDALDDAVALAQRLSQLQDLRKAPHRLEIGTAALEHAGESMQRVRFALVVAKMLEDGKALTEVALCGVRMPFEQSNGAKGPQRVSRAIGIAQLTAQREGLLMVIALAHTTLRRPRAGRDCAAR